MRADFKRGKQNLDKFKRKIQMVAVIAIGKRRQKLEKKERR